MLLVSEQRNNGLDKKGPNQKRKNSHAKHHQPWVRWFADSYSRKTLAVWLLLHAQMEPDALPLVMCARSAYRGLVTVQTEGVRM